MKVAELIEKLEKMPQDALIGFTYDGAHRGDVDYVHEANSGYVLLSEEGCDLYYEEDMPKGTPKEYIEKGHLPLHNVLGKPMGTDKYGNNNR